MTTTIKTALVTGASPNDFVMSRGLGIPNEIQKVTATA
jgi:hypothetical protein